VRQAAGDVDDDDFVNDVESVSVSSSLNHVICTTTTTTTTTSR